MINLLESYKGFCAPPSSPWQTIGKSTFLVKDKKEIRSTKIEEKIKTIKQLASYFHEVNESKGISQQDLGIPIGLMAIQKLEKPASCYSARSKTYNSINKLQKITSCLKMQQHTYTLKVGMYLALNLHEFVKINNELIYSFKWRFISQRKK